MSMFSCLWTKSLFSEYLRTRREVKPNIYFVFPVKNKVGEIYK